MPLSPAADREPIQTRAIEVSSYRRTDGQWDVEGNLTDTSAYAFDNEYRGTIEPGVPIHDMWIRLTLDETVTITEVDAVMDGTPYAICPGIAAAFQKLEGEKIGPGWNRKIRDFFGGAKGCIHMVDLLRPIGTIGYKTVKREAGRRNAVEDEKSSDMPYQVNTCHAMASDSEVVKKRWPHLYTGTP
ncbi:MAG: hypothetical protein CMM52_10300 [Rhodospirillaceae bacterium]|nr:hypothetical protein [Rhodospirillaceae bacterium]|tara:strand:+ start:51537 stop:52094 length:558 start_codon:yes stop_codon:yes gene_type:complete